MKATTISYAMAEAVAKAHNEGKTNNTIKTAAAICAKIKPQAGYWTAPEKEMR